MEMALPDYVNFGDIEAAVVDYYINDCPLLIAHIPVTNISTNMVGYVDGDRWIQITQQGSVEVWPTVDRPRIDVEVYAERRSVALDLANIALGYLKMMPGNYTGFGLTVTDCKREQGITRIPDPYIESSRYIFARRLTTRPVGDPLVPPSS